MKRLARILAIASFAAVPLFSHAADAEHVSRAHVRAELFAAARTGQYPQSYAHYPDAAPDRGIAYAARHAQATDGDTSYGASTTGRSASGKRASADGSVDDRSQFDQLYNHP
jgi:hypothetical protein